MIFTARRCASAVYVVIVCPSVSPCVCLSVPYKSEFYTEMGKPIGSRKQRNSITQELFFSFFSGAKDLDEIPMEHLQRGRQIQVR